MIVDMDINAIINQSGAYCVIYESQLFSVVQHLPSIEAVVEMDSHRHILPPLLAEKKV